VKGQPEERNLPGFFDFILGSWLLAHDLADRAIHASQESLGSSLLPRILSQAHHSETKLKHLIEEVANKLGLATKNDLREIREILEKIKALQKRR
jgi:hypothetical protein